MDANYAALTAIAGLISELTGARSGNLAEANSVAAWQVLTDARAEGKTAAEMLATPLKACLLFNIDPAHDALHGDTALATLHETGMVVHIGNYTDADLDECCHVQLPLAAFSETDGTHINCEGKLQSWVAAVSPMGDARPGWKILRVLGNFLSLEGFDYNLVGEVSEEAIAGLADTEPKPGAAEFSIAKIPADRLQRIFELPLYRTDGIVRRANSLQSTADNKVSAEMHPDTLLSIGAEEGASIRFSDGERSVELTVTGSQRVPVQCVVIPVATADSAALGAATNVETSI
jgi:NADH-quinone oxidoreductase subunit G